MTLRGTGSPQAANQRRTHSRWLRRSALVGAIGLLTVTLSGCSWSTVLGLGWPEGITPEAHHNRHFWVGVVIASLTIGAIVWGLMFWCMIVYRKRATDTELPRQFGYNMPLEMVLTVIPFLIISVLFYFTVLVQEDQLEIDPNPEVVVDVTAFQWNWKFGYNKVEFADGSYSYDGAQPERKDPMRSKPEGVDHHGQELVGPVRGLNVEDRSFLYFDEVETLGTTEEIPVLVVPTGRRIEFRLIATDVVHAFFVPEFLFKRDMMPYPEANNSVNVFQVSEVTKEGAFVGHCAEMCGTYHAMMNFELRAVSPNEFKRYLDYRRDGLTNAEALSEIGQSPVATSTRPFDSGRGLRAQANS